MKKKGVFKSLYDNVKITTKKLTIFKEIESLFEIAPSFSTLEY